MSRLRAIYDQVMGRHVREEAYERGRAILRSHRGVIRSLSASRHRELSALDGDELVGVASSSVEVQADDEGQANDGGAARPAR